ncbi:MAG: GTPase domain-containing protein [Pirellulales bacterium]
MSADFHAWAAQVKRLHHALGALAPAARAVGLPPPDKEEWYELLAHKLLAQLDAPPVLVVAVVGGTNIGKSLVFNHLGGEMASAVSPLAAGTRHPVCLAPEGCDREELLQGLFDGFQLRRWQSADDALADTAEHLLFWRRGQAVPERLLLLDTPDIDSDVAVNWQRADQIRQSADVLIAVLTQQKYNDAAVKQFFRKAAEADKAVVVVFNQCDLEGDRDYWPRWLETFSGETGATPHLVYVIPYDRAAAGELQLPFYPAGADGQGPLGPASSLREELASLHFDAIKIRTFQGALARVLDESEGAAGYLARLRQASGEFAAAAAALSTSDMARVQWPALPARLLVEEIRGWWDASRSPWSRQVHGFYRVLGQGVLWPVRKAWEGIAGPAPEPLAAFHTSERDAIVEAVQKLLDELDRLSQVGNDTLRPRLAGLLGGASRQQLLERVIAAHAELPALDDDYRDFLRAELDRWGEANPRAVSLLRSLDHVAALARPAITVSLAVSGWIVAGDVVGQAAAHVAGQTVSTLATEAAIAGGITGGGEAVVTATGEGVKQAAARLFRRLQTGYAERRAGWLAGWLERELLGGLLDDLRAGAEAPESQAVADIESALASLRVFQAD